MMLLKKMSLINRDKILKILLNFYQNKFKILRLKLDCLKEKVGIFIQWLPVIRRISLDQFQIKYDKNKYILFQFNNFYFLKHRQIKSKKFFNKKRIDQKSLLIIHAQTLAFCKIYLQTLSLFLSCTPLTSITYPSSVLTTEFF